MKELFTVSAITSEMQNHFDVLECFLHSATELYAVAVDGINKNSDGSIGMMSNEFWNQNLVTSFFLFRHAIELGVKALIKEVSSSDVNGHDIQKLWEKNIPNYRAVLVAEISKAFSVLKKFNVLNDAQLFRYHNDKGGNRLKDLPAIENDDFNALSDLAWKIRQAILEVKHSKISFSV